jgi:hypothetical protein
MRMVDEQSLAIAWADKVFERPTRTRITPTGKMIRKTILMESEEWESDPTTESDTGEAQPEEILTVPAGTSAKTLRELADLEERRQRGEISEYEYEKQRKKILDANSATDSN